MIDYKKGNTAILAVVGVIALAIIGGFGYTFFTSQNSESSDLPTSILDSTPHPAADDRDSMVDEDVMQKSNKYVQFSSGMVEKYSQEKRVVLFFYANWCPTCQPVNRELEQRQAELPDDVVVIRVNYNDTDTDAEEEALADEYAVTYQHTFVILENSEQVAKWNGDSVDRVLEELGS